MDKLDFAYFCMGINNYLRLFPRASGFEGHLDFVDKCIKHFDLIEQLEEPEGGYDYAFPYHVASPFGYLVATQVSLGQGDPSSLRKELYSYMEEMEQ